MGGTRTTKTGSLLTVSSTFRECNSGNLTPSTCRGKGEMGEEERAREKLHLVTLVYPEAAYLAQ